MKAPCQASNTADQSAQSTAGTVKQFTLGQFLTITDTDTRLMCHLRGVYEILSHITGDVIFTHTIPRAIRFSAPILRDQHPGISITDAQSEDLARRIEQTIPKNSDMLLATVEEWLKGLELPMVIDVKSHSDAWLSMDPAAELSGMMGGDEKIIAVSPKAKLA